MNFLLTLLLLTFSTIAGAQKLSIPPLTSPVMDQAGFMSEAERGDLSRMAYEIYTNKGPQITILTVPDLQGWPIEEFSIRVAEKWQLGLKEKGNGLLIIASREERKLRIEVGEGIEGEVTDFEANQYINHILVPAFRSGDFHGGLRQVMLNIAGKFNIPVEQGRYVRPRAPARPGKLNALLPLLMMVLVIGHLFLGKKRVARGLFSGAGMAGVGYFMLPGIGAGVLFLFFLGLIFGLAGVSNILYMMAAGGRGGRYGGGGFGGGWGGGGGGFSGGGSSGSW